MNLQSVVLTGRRFNTIVQIQASQDSRHATAAICPPPGQFTVDSLDQSFSLVNFRGNQVDNAVVMKFGTLLVTIPSSTDDECNAGLTELLLILELHHPHLVTRSNRYVWLNLTVMNKTAQQWCQYLDVKNLIIGTLQKQCPTHAVQIFFAFYVIPVC